MEIKYSDAVKAFESLSSDMYSAGSYITYSGESRALSGYKKAMDINSFFAALAVLNIKVTVEANDD